ncbi:MAG: flagellar biosynthetic protein FliR [Lachnospiraceae bacterium]|nr:flagellar biosynthetic protein FliR [Lachnospiraceae bacterium]
MINTTFELNSIEYFLLILTRISTFVYVAPFFGQRNVPGRIKVGLSVFVAILVYFGVSPTMQTYSTTLGYGFLVLIEGITGLLIGFMANICNSIITFAGTMIDMHVGLSMAQEYNPTLQSQVTVSGELYYYFIMMLLIVTNMHQYILRALIDSFSVINLGGANFNPDTMLTQMIAFITDLFIIAFRITLPIFACVMILNCILGIMAKVAPQMNMFAVGIQIKVLVGFSVMFLTIFLLPDMADFIFKEIKNMVTLTINNITPTT